MKYIVCQEPGVFKFAEKPMPVPASDEALLKINKIGICGTDLHAFKGNQPFFSYPRILGHELAAQVVSIPNHVNHLKPGDKVAIMPYISCGKCIACRNGKTNCCTQLQVLGVHTDGGMQEYFTIHPKFLVQANNLSDDAIAIVEPLAIGAHAVKRAAISEKDVAVVVGAGPIGIGILFFAMQAGATVILVDLNESRLAYCKNNLGVAHHVVKAGDQALKAIQDLTQGDMAHVVFDATGHKGALETGIQYMAHGGKYVLVGLNKGNLEFHHPYIHARETTLLCSRNATPSDFQHVMQTLQAGEFPINQYISHHLAFENMIDDFEKLYDPDNGVVKAIVSF